MSSSAVKTGDPIMRAYANLKAVRDNLGNGYVHEEGFYRQYGRALDELQQAGVDVGEWRIAHSEVGNIDGKEFRAKIDAILIYFSAQNPKTKIGFALQ
jgi:hypothetical protein